MSLGVAGAILGVWSQCPTFVCWSSDGAGLPLLFLSPLWGTLRSPTADPTSSLAGALARSGSPKLGAGGKWGAVAPPAQGPLGLTHRIGSAGPGQALGERPGVRGRRSPGWQPCSGPGGCSGGAGPAQARRRISDRGVGARPRRACCCACLPGPAGGGAAGRWVAPSPGGVRSGPATARAAGNPRARSRPQLLQRVFVAGSRGVCGLGARPGPGGGSRARWQHLPRARLRLAGRARASAGCKERAKSGTGPPPPPAAAAAAAAAAPAWGRGAALAAAGGRGSRRPRRGSCRGPLQAHRRPGPAERRAGKGGQARRRLSSDLQRRRRPRAPRPSVPQLGSGATDRLRRAPRPPGSATPTAARSANQRRPRGGYQGDAAPRPAGGVASARHARFSRQNSKAGRAALSHLRPGAEVCGGGGGAVFAPDYNSRRAARPARAEAP